MDLEILKVRVILSLHNNLILVALSFQLCPFKQRGHRVVCESIFTGTRPNITSSGLVVTFYFQR